MAAIADRLNSNGANATTSYAKLGFSCRCRPCPDTTAVTAASRGWPGPSRHAGPDLAVTFTPWWAVCNSEPQTLHPGGRMAQKPVLFLTCVVLSVAWYLAVGAFDRLFISRVHQTISQYCYTEHLPADTVLNPEGFIFPPMGTYDFAPLGVECVFATPDGTTTDSFSVRSYPMVLACIPGTATLMWGARIAWIPLHPRRKTPQIGRSA